MLDRWPQFESSLQSSSGDIMAPRGPYFLSAKLDLQTAHLQWGGVWWANRGSVVITDLRSLLVKKLCFRTLGLEFVTWPDLIKYVIEGRCLLSAGL
ncbi:hypothetical protein AAFF_G00243570 [Aldrovandia affinis]|uniref:Uncharacterized protein n=1 Tax=Aldrovandia affinis TaxID=143900 RepID=A0AAD7W4A0_9TELE|nr:hypothetical protein AAFF_G00243570 [Aldrovandia affinis]